MFRLNDLIELIPQSMLIGNGDEEWESLSIDTRTIHPGELYFALKGEKYDGHQFIEDACKRGAIGIVMEKSFFDSCPSITETCKKTLIVVDDTLLAFHQWAHYYYSLYQPFNICITGSNGKTTTKEMIAHLLNLQYHVLKSQGNYNNEIGVPLTIFGLTPDHDVLVVEMAAQRLGEIKTLTDIVKPDIAIVTNVGEAHIGLFGSRDNIAREKSEIILALKDKGTAILNRDDSYFNYFKDCLSNHNELFTFGFHPEAHLRAMNFNQESEKGISFDLKLASGKVQHLSMPLLGRFNVYNALAAFAVGMKMHIPVNKILHRLSSFVNLKMHMEYAEFYRGITILQDCYNANPTATIEAMLSAAAIADNRFKVAVLGDMLELGPETAKYHKEVGRKAVSFSYDMLVGYGENSLDICRGAQEQGMPADQVVQFGSEEKERLVNFLAESVPDGSMVLIKGSRNMKMEDIFQSWDKKEKEIRRSHHG
ncbi:MAG: UDP-N-acetylmuramoyl-tripeptide--D-alanyl-D-alanine ligase [Candidatus Atribacteria bacterium]|nr:UDP-N-acetylmuramoyl-tripeptide--D-alanyl-D-alanine ligase [Candidatus Atribacteria bacterium]